MSPEQMKLDISNVVCRFNLKSTDIMHVMQYGVHSESHDRLKCFGNNDIPMNSNEIIISKKRYKIEIELQWKNNMKSHEFLRAAAFLQLRNSE